MPCTESPKTPNPEGSLHCQNYSLTSTEKGVNQVCRENSCKDNWSLGPQSVGCFRPVGSSFLRELTWTSLIRGVSHLRYTLSPRDHSKRLLRTKYLLHTGDSLTPKMSLTSLTGCLFFFLRVWVYVLYLFFTAAAWVRVNVDRSALPSSSSLPEIRVDNPTSCSHSASSSPSGKQHEQAG